MQPMSTAFAQPTPGAGSPGVPGAAGMSTVYYDDENRQRKAAEEVPVDQFGRIAGVKYACRKCRASSWFPGSLKGVPACGGCHKRMERQEVKPPPLLPYRELWDAIERPLRPVWALPAMAAAGYAVDAAAVPALVLAGAAPVVGELARRVAEAQKVRAQVARGRLEADDPEGGKRLRAAIARQSRLVGYGAAGGVGWLALAAGLGVDPSTVAGKVALGAMVALWLAPAATWWWRGRRARDVRPAAPIMQSAVEPQPEAKDATFGELIAQRWAETVGATPQQGQAKGQPVALVGTGGTLPGTVLEGVHRVTGGWAATIVDPKLRGLEWVTAGVRRNIAAVFGVGIASVSLEPDAEDANRCFVMVQPQSPLKDVVRWDGPQSVDAKAGTGMAGRYADGTTMFYEVYRPGWGVPHDALFGTTGSGKSEMFCQLMTIDRWMHYVDGHGVPRGMVADLLLDPQHGQSFGPFLDDLAAPVATSLDEAMIVLMGLEREGLRRNEFLAQVQWPDPKRRGPDGQPVMRKGRKFWDPFQDGPLLVANIDEAHFFLAFRLFAERLTAAARMWRKCGIKIRLATHTPLLSDLGGSMALRDMLTGGFVWVGRTANSLTSGTAFNGQLPVDPRSIPKVPGMSYALTGQNPRALLMRSAWEPDYYDWVRDENNAPIGYPADLPQVTLNAMGREFVEWRASGRVAEQSPSTSSTRPGGAVVVDAVLSALSCASESMDMDDLAAATRPMGTFTVGEMRDALGRLRDAGLVFTSDSRHELTPQAREDIEAQLAAKLDALGGGES